MNNDKRWCHNCGQEINFVKFCPHCGASQSSLEAKPPALNKPRNNTFTPRIVGGQGAWSDEEQEAQESLNEIPADRVQSVAQLGISLARDNPNLGIELIERGLPQQKETIGQVVQEGAIMPNKISDIRPGVFVNPQLVIDEFKKEAGGVPTITLGQGAVSPISRMHQNRGD